MIIFNTLPPEIVLIIREFTLYHCRDCSTPLNYWMKSGPPITNHFATCRKCYEKSKIENNVRNPYCIIPTFYDDIDEALATYNAL